MSTFVDLAFKPKTATDYPALKRLLIRTYRVGVRMDVSQTSILQHLGYDPREGFLCVNIFDSTASDAATVLASEWDLSPDYATELPRTILERIRLIFQIAIDVQKRVHSDVCIIGFSDGGHYYEHKFVTLNEAIELITSDCDDGGFVGNSYEISNL